jgi:uncharacterized protein YdhG (YjbR/CyaY superfamily)
MSPRPTIATVPDYLATLDPATAKILRRVHATIRKSVPKAIPVISYGIPAFKIDCVFIYCAAFKQHIGIYPPLRSDAKLRMALKPYTNAKGNLRFPLEETMPLTRIARLAKALARQYATQMRAKSRRQ